MDRVSLSHPKVSAVGMDGAVADARTEGNWQGPKRTKCDSSALSALFELGPQGGDHLQPSGISSATAWSSLSSAASQH